MCVILSCQACDIPEAELPEPFNQRMTTIKDYSTPEKLPTLYETEILNSSHLPPSFQKHFDQKAALAEMEKTDILSPVESACEVNEVFERVKSPPDSYSSANTSETTTPMKPLAGIDCLAVETPSLSTPLRPISPKRSVLTCEDQNKMTSSHKQSTATAKKSLDFNSFDGEETFITPKRNPVCLSDLVLLVHQIFQSVKFYPITKEELVQKIIMNSFEFDNHSKHIFCHLTFFFNYQFLSPHINAETPELLFCVYSGEVEMQMENLEKLAPDWIFKKMAPSGDLLYK